MPTAKNRFHILVLHLKKHIIEKKTHLFIYFYWTFTQILTLRPKKHIYKITIFLMPIKLKIPMIRSERMDSVSTDELISLGLTIQFALK